MNEALAENIPMETTKESSMSRNQRRKIERLNKDQEVIRHRYMFNRIKVMRQDIAEYMKVYETSYQNFIDTTPQNNGLKKVKIVMSVDKTDISLEEVMQNTINADSEEIQHAIIPGTKNVRIMYLRTEMHLTFDKDADVIARSGVPETVTASGNDKVLVQLFYHAIAPMSEDTPNKLIEAEHNLLKDFMTHLFCMGVDMQQMNNAKLWNKKLHAQTENLQSKADEVTEIFSKIGETVNE
jgi:hypothetical protein